MDVLEGTLPVMPEIMPMAWKGLYLLHNVVYRIPLIEVVFMHGLWE